jgi:hypothetical protein
MATVVDLSVDQGDLFRYTVNVTIDGVVVNLTGWTAHLEVRGDRRLSAPLLYSVSSPGVLTVLGSAAQIQMDVPSAVTKLWTWDEGQYDLTLTDPIGEKYRVLQGAIRINHTVTA